MLTPEEILQIMNASHVPGATADEHAVAYGEAIEAAAVAQLLERIAALEAKLAQRVPDLCRKIIHEGDHYAIKMHTARNSVEAKLLKDAWATAVESVLSAAPAAPEQQKECWCESCDIAQGHPMGRTRMSVCPQCGDKRCPRAKHHDSACQVAPEQQEPPPMQAAPLTEECTCQSSEMTFGQCCKARTPRGGV